MKEEVQKMYEFQELQQNPITRKWIFLVPSERPRSRFRRRSKTMKRWLLQLKWYRQKEGEIRPLWLWG